MGTILSIIAVCISLLSLAMSAYAVVRDRKYVSATSDVSYDKLNSRRFLQIEIVDSGRRPAFIKYLIQRRNRFCCSQSIEYINVTGLTLDDIVKQKYNLPIVKLNEGEYYRIVINQDDMTMLYISQLDEHADSLMLEDVLGKRYKIKKIKKSIKKFLDAKNTG